MLTHQLIATFHHVICEQTGNDVTIGRAKTMVALASITWPDLEIVVSPHIITPERITWKSDEIDSFSAGASFRRDPVGDDAPIIIENVEADQLTMPDRMRECASIIPLFGRQRLERFNFTLAGIFSHKARNIPLLLPDSAPDREFPYETEYRRLFGWLAGHGAVTADGKWPQIGNLLRQ
jgi:hypothetical protein